MIFCQHEKGIIKKGKSSVTYLICDDFFVEMLDEKMTEKVGLRIGMES